MEILNEEILYGLDVPIIFGMELAENVIEETYKCFGDFDEF